MEEAEKAKKDKNELRKGKKRLKRGKCSIDMGEKNKNGRERQWKACLLYTSKVNFNIKEKLKKTFSKEHLKEVFTGEEQKKHLKQGSYSSIMTVIVLAVIVVINLIVAQIPTSKTQIDLSTQKMYSITDETKTALKDLDQDVTLYYIVQKGSEDDTCLLYTSRCV